MRPQQAQHIMVMFARRRGNAQDPIKQIWVRAVEQGFKPIELVLIQLPEASVGE